MATKKGPPVPPRPKARTFEPTSTNSNSVSQSTTNNSIQGRTLVYQRSPADNVSQHQNIKSVTQIVNTDTAKNISTGRMSKVIPAPKPRSKPTGNNSFLLKENDDVSLRAHQEATGPNNKSERDIHKGNVSINNNKASNPEYENRSVKEPMILINKRCNNSKVNKTDFPNKVLGEIEVIMNKNVSKDNDMPMRPEPEGKESKNLAMKTVEEKICESKLAFSKKLLSELTSMRQTYRNNNNVLKNDNSVIKERETVSMLGTSNIRRSDWIEVEDNGKTVLMTSCHISLEDSGMEDEEKPDDCSSGVGDSWDSVKENEERIKMSLPGLPPLPKSLVAQAQTHSVSTSEYQRGLSPIQRQPATLDTQLAILRREMYGLRQLDLSLLSQLWTLNESIQEFRTMLQEQETLSPPSPSPSNSNSESEIPSSEDEQSSDNHLKQVSTPAHQAPLTPAQVFQNSSTNTSRMRIAPPPPPINRKTPQSRPV